MASAIYRAAMQGQVFREIAEEHGICTSYAHALAYKYAEQRSLPAPVRQAQARRAYRLRADGLGWAEVAERTGHASANSALAAARVFARRAGMVWPVRMWR